MRLRSPIPIPPPSTRALLALSPSPSFHRPTWLPLQHHHRVRVGAGTQRIVLYQRGSFSTTSCLIPRQAILDDLPLSVLSQASRPVHRQFIDPYHSNPDPPSTVTKSKSSSDRPANTMASTSTSPRRPPPPPTHVLETALQVRDIAASTKFYKETLGVEPSLDTPRMSVFALGQTTLLLFQLGATAADSPLPNNKGVIPGHGPSEDILSLLAPKGRSDQPSDPTNTATTKAKPTSHLKQHFCLAVPSVKDVNAWEEWFKECGSRVVVTGTVEWPKGGRSVYFADLDGNVGEIGSRGIWDHY